VPITVTPIENRLSPGKRGAPTVGVGWDAFRAVIGETLAATGPRKRWIALDGYTGCDWNSIRTAMEKLPSVRRSECLFVDAASCLRGEREVHKLLEPFLPEGDPLFGRVYPGRLASFFDRSNLKKLSATIRSRREPVVVCYGSGATLLRPGRSWDLVLYFDLTREEVLRRNRSWTGRKSRTQSISPRRIYYVDFPVHDRHRARTLPIASHYVDANDPAVPKILSSWNLRALVDAALHAPLRVKPLYEPGVWGGQWLIRQRKVPGGLANCAYGLELIAPEQSLLLTVDGTTVELPFNLLMETAPERVMGEEACRRFANRFPIRVSYDDTWRGGNLSIQVHPPARYMHSRFGEPMHQAEMYYLFAASRGSFVHLGFREGIDPGEFRRQARESESRKTRFDHRKYVNMVPARKGDILLIPPGTVHGAGADELVLEIGSTPYRYTFKIYDYRRPDLDGGFRPLSTEHAFNVVRWERTERWVRSHLLPEPRLLRSGPGWREHVIANSRFFHHVVHRIEFDGSYTDDTRGTFHLVLVEGSHVTIVPRGRPGAARPLALSETVLVPAAVGAYRVVNRGARPCRVVKAFLRAGSRGGRHGPASGG
jgi:mannose-6-phosphate isomerase class I